MRSSNLTVAQYLQFVGASAHFAASAADVFAVVASLLQKSGAYTRSISDLWPPRESPDTPPKAEDASRWAITVRRIGKNWREAMMEVEPNVPKDVSDLWNRVLQPGALTVTGLQGDDAYCTALLELSAIADEACEGVGIPPLRDEFEREAWVTLDDRGSLCKYVDSSILRVLPKCHTPQVGMTMRSLSHHLSLIEGGDVEPQWYIVPTARPEPRGLNILLVPLPRMVLPGAFRAADGPLQNMGPDFGFFTCKDIGPVDVDAVARLLDRASSLVGSVDAVVLPELAVSPTEYDELRDRIVGARKAMLVAGVGVPATQGRFGENYVRFDLPVDVPATAEDDQASVAAQHKHHRWLLDRGQIAQYGLSTSLDPTRKWWECVDIARRELAFVSIAPWLTTAVLICEDLARQDPVAELIRCVGPNLVISLLADGPQLAARWSARYATVLADDPGSSVLTLTSVGMVDLCRGPRRMLEARPVALWKDAITGGPYELNLPSDADALLLSLGVEKRTEWSADGRGDQGSTAYLTMRCVHPIAGSR